jgi:Asp-tRNA(Asn)/Glu-tRNA(Gln) amidotransferase A subunit family amidase
VRGDLAVIGPMARSAADLARLLRVTAGPDEELGGIGYKLALPPPRHAKLNDFRVLVIDKHPLCPTAAKVAAALDKLADRLGKIGCTVLPTRESMGLGARMHAMPRPASWSGAPKRREIVGFRGHRWSRITTSASPSRQLLRVGAWMR